MNDGRTDRHTYVECETIIPRHYRVAGYKKYHNESAALEISVINYLGCGVGFNLAFRDPNPYPQLHSGKTCICSVCIEVFYLIHESLRATNQSQIKPIMKQR